MGMKCPRCGSKAKVYKTGEHNPLTNTYVRHRECVDCKYRFKTVEKFLYSLGKRDKEDDI